MLTKTIIENSLLIIGESFWLFSAIAQLVHVIKKKDVRGLSAITTALNAAANIGWITYFASRQLWLPVATNAGMLFVTVGLLINILQHNRKQLRLGLLTIAIVGPLTSYALIKYPMYAGWMGMAYNWIASTPFLIKVVRTRQVGGISGRSVGFVWGALTMVLGYGLMVNATPLVFGCLQGIVYHAIITRYYFKYRDK